MVFEVGSENCLIPGDKSQVIKAVLDEMFENRLLLVFHTSEVRRFSVSGRRMNRQLRATWVFGSTLSARSPGIVDARTSWLIHCPGLSDVI